MKKIIPAGLLTVSLLAFCSSGLAADFKIATVDLRKVFDTYYKTIQASIANSNNIVERDKELNAMIDARRKREDEWRQQEGNANNQIVSSEERAKYKKVADDLLLDLQIRGESISNYYATTESKRRDEMVRHVNDLTTEIRGVLEAMAKKQGYTLVLDRTALTMTGNPLVLYTSGENDLTEPLIKELNSTAPAAPAPEPKSPADTSLLPAPGAKIPPDKPAPK
jgi:Skp family chaperone for outer membrane proteins